MIEVHSLVFEPVKLVQQKVFADERGFFVENYRQPIYEQKGISTSFVQDNHSFSKKGTLRGMHFQSSPGQAKLVGVIIGKIYDVFVDIRPDSPTFGQWGCYELDAEKHEQIFIPAGFAHGFVVLSDTAHVVYKVSTLYHPQTEKTFRFDDPQVGIQWPVSHPLLSEKDRLAANFAEVVKR